MKKSKKHLFLLLSILIITLTACATVKIEEATKATVAPSVVSIQPPGKILFIGNSFTFYNRGIEKHLKLLAASANPPLHIRTERQTFPGRSLKGHYKTSHTLYKIQKGNWDVVIVQGYSNEPIKSGKRFSKYARLLDEEIKKSGAQTVFFMTWAYKNHPNMTVPLRNAYVNIGNELSAMVAPVGLAWERALRERPRLKLYSDFKHPNKKGTYLSACVFYGSLFGRPPIGLSYTVGIPDDEAKFLQKIAWQTVQSFR